MLTGTTLHNIAQYLLGVKRKKFLSKFSTITPVNSVCRIRIVKAKPKLAWPIKTDANNIKQLELQVNTCNRSKAREIVHV